MKFLPNLNDERSKMISSSGEKDFQAKQEGDTKVSKLSKTTSTSRQWAGFKNPRIVRVSRSFAGKDRHSKVCTIRGLRDRRIRLSVPTAVQLYDLQDRLGLGQPSKVVDWLLDATKHEVDKLPPLQMPPGDFSQFYQNPHLVPRDSSATQSSLSSFFNEKAGYAKDGGIKINDHVDGNDQAMTVKSKYWASDSVFGAKCKEVEKESTSAIVENKWITTNEQENDQGGNGGYMAQIAAQNFFPVANQSSFPGLLNNYYHWEPSNLSLSQFGSQGFPSHTDHQNSTHSVSLPSSLALPSASPLFFCPTATTPTLFPPLYPPYMTPSLESDPRQINHFQLLSSSTQLPNSLVSPLHLISSSPLKSFPLNVNPKLHSQNNNDTQPNKSS